MFSNYYLVGRSGLPIWIRVIVLSFVSSIVIFLKYGVFILLLFRFFSLFYIIIFWTYLVGYERLSGKHRKKFLDALKFSFGLFVFSELIFFMSVFWTFFDSALSPTVELGGNWSPSGVSPINPLGVPLFNTVILLRSGVTLTWSHNNLLRNKNRIIGLLFTLLLAFIFEFTQYFEFCESTFSISDGIFGRIFFFGTGFHGIHVIFGHIFLTYNLVRLLYNNFTSLNHVGYEFSILYWHFVDVVWLFLYCFFYLYSFGF